MTAQVNSEHNHEAKAASAPVSPQSPGENDSPSADVQGTHGEEGGPARLAFEPQDFASLNLEVDGALSAHRQVGQLQDGAGLPRKVMRRSLTWYTAPLHLYQGASIRALQRLSTISQAHEDHLATMVDVIEELRSQNAHLAEVMEELRNQDTHLAEEITALKKRPRYANLLRENDTIVDYWDNAALTDPTRETVTQGANESDEEYQQNWVKLGEYVAKEIMSHSSPNPVALEVGPAWDVSQSQCRSTAARLRRSTFHPRWRCAPGRRWQG